MKILIIAVVVIVLGIGAYVVLGGPAAEPVLAPEYTSTQEETPIPVDIDGGIGSTPAATVTLTNEGFSPATVTVNVGDTVRFVNQSTKTMWVGADVHPSHADYDGTTRQEHCPTGGSFDQCTGSGSGTTWEFTFDKAGTFGYHNHLGASDTGTVIVK